ncbi:NUDIX domain-containing protein [Streptomyces sp. RerS4]|uniref:NUDIX hydrolase n=1 Tax=Streptomyces sp. RerS4 TaxID=2942449 RepID=UPI00201C1A69|nr:NUDIX domain-containing protein [Streptomyces sp. RerS4]UQX00428.1 NUDIX domain-containing protein [Streptomyces sp. RerS4]
MSAADEVLDVVDRNDRVIGRAPRGEVYRRGLIHRCVFVLATDERGRIFVHRRTASKLVFPSHYDMFVGGVLGTGEDYADAALREASEELGVSGLERPAPLFKFLYEGPGGTWWSYVHEVRCDLPVAPQESEVDWHAWLSPRELGRRVADGVWPWVPDGLEAWRRLEAWRAGSP